MSEIQDLKNHVLALDAKINNLLLIIQGFNRNNDNINEVVNMIHNLGLERSKQNNIIFETIYPDLIRRMNAMESFHREEIEKKRELERTKKVDKFKLGDYVIAYYGRYTRAGQISDISEKGFIKIDDGVLNFHPNQVKFQGE